MEAPHLGEIDEAEAASEALGQIGGQFAKQGFASFGTLSAYLFLINYCLLIF